MKNQNDLEFVKTHGMQVYAEGVSLLKPEEMRKKVLKSMGLDETSLAELPVAQGRAIEEVISRKIEKQATGVTSKPAPRAIDNQAYLKTRVLQEKDYNFFENVRSESFHSARQMVEKCLARKKSYVFFRSTSVKTAG